MWMDEDLTVDEDVDDATLSGWVSSMRTDRNLRDVSGCLDWIMPSWIVDARREVGSLHDVGVACTVT
jgi:hypothetical protein